MRRLLAMLALTLGALALVPVASASAANTVSGECTISGNAAFSPNGLTATPQTLTYQFGGNGTCSGTLNGVPIVNAPVSAFATGTGTLSCVAAAATGGTGTLTFPGQGVTLGFHIDLAGAGSEVAFTLTGNGGGAGAGHATFGQNAARVAECADPSGINSLGFDVQAAAVSLTG
jgi:hypothetical protein